MPILLLLPNARQPQRPRHNLPTIAQWGRRSSRTAGRVPDALGTATEMRGIKNYAGDRLSPRLEHLMISRQETARPLLTPGEVMQLPPTTKQAAQITVTSLADTATAMALTVLRSIGPGPRRQTVGRIELFLIILLSITFDCVVSVPAVPMPMPSLPMMNWPRWWRVGRPRQPQRKSGIGPGRTARGARQAGKRNTDTNSKDCRSKSLMHQMNSRTAAAKARYRNRAI
jgi:hypothetical protein